MAHWQAEGFGIGRQLALGRAWVVRPALELVESSFEAAPALSADDECARLRSAIAQIQTELSELRARLLSQQTEVEAFLDLQELLLQDPLLIDDALSLIGSERIGAERALIRQMQAVLSRFDEIDDPYIRERRADVVQLVERIVGALAGQGGAIHQIPPPTEAMQQAHEGWILVAHDIAPADMIRLRESGLVGFAIDGGSPTAHTSILARGLGLPALVGTRDLTQRVQTGDLLLLDPQGHRVVGGLGMEALQEARDQIAQEAQALQALEAIRPLQAQTADGVAIDLLANIEFPSDVASAVDHGCDGVGLFRTEFLFMNREALPTEEEQYLAYRSVVEQLGGRPLTLRTLDAGADKAVPLLQGGRAEPPNPALSLRAVRLCLAEPELFKTQLRAALRASAHGPLRLMIPLVSGPGEMVQTRRLILEAQGELRAQGLAFNPKTPVGAMIELPSAALGIDGLLAHIDFASIGTNDLIQYTLAVDRSDPEVAHLYEPLSPAVLRLIYRVIQACHRAQTPVSLCGEMAGDPELTPLLLGLGLTSFSMPAVGLLSVKAKLRAASRQALQAPVRRLLRLPEASMVRRGLAGLPQ